MRIAHLIAEFSGLNASPCSGLAPKGAALATLLDVSVCWGVT
jgi:hypothetical protein